MVHSFLDGVTIERQRYWAQYQAERTAKERTYWLSELKGPTLATHAHGFYTTEWVVMGMVTIWLTIQLLSYLRFGTPWVHNAVDHEQARIDAIWFAFINNIDFTESDSESDTQEADPRRSSD
jgi:hypothetical protein